MDNLDFLVEFSHLGPVSSSVGEVLHELKACMQHPDAGMFFEMEARLGVVSEQGGYVSDIGEECFTTLLTALESYPHWHRVSDWSESQDVFYVADFPNSLEGKTARAEVRTTVGLDDEKRMVLKHCIKRRLRNLDFKVVAMNAGESTYLSGVQEALRGPANPRVSFSVEQSVPAEVLPIAVVPTKVRIKQRKRFFVASLGVERPAFAIDMTIVYAGRSKSEAEQNQVRGANASYEVEVECLEPLAYLQSCNHREEMLALSLLLKLHDFVALLNPDVPVTFVKAR